MFSPGLAATIGLEEAVLLQHLQQLFEHREAQERQNYAWLSIERAYLECTLPFWAPKDLQRITRSLADKGVLLIDSPPLTGSDTLVFALNEKIASRTQAQANAPETAPSDKAPQRSTHSAISSWAQSNPNAASASGKTAIPNGPISDDPLTTPPPVQPRRATVLPMLWEPSEDLLQLLNLNHNIPRQFALDQIEDFIFYWRERGEVSHAWENKFRQHVIANWRRHEQEEAEAFLKPDLKPLDKHWRPSLDALEIMQRNNIPADFIEEAIPEFILYWRERGAAPKELNSKFIQHIRIQWARYSTSLDHNTEPTRITKNWQPAEDVYDILELSHIDIAFARALLPEFIVYWRDSNQVQTSWNSKFLKHVKYHWAKRHQMQQADEASGNIGRQKRGQSGLGSTGRTRDRSLEQDLNDTSWAK